MKLYEKRKAAGLTQDAVAKELNVTPSAVSQWESGDTRPKIEYLPALARLYGCTIEELLREDNG